MEPTNTPTTPVPTPIPEPTPTQAPNSDPVVTLPDAAPSLVEPPVSSEPLVPSEPPVSAEPLVMPDLGAMDPITMPTPPKTPDPVEEELKAPLKAAEPVPGSIGSAISVPAENGVRPNAQTPSVAFNDPAMQNKMAVEKNDPKKKVGTNTWILLAALAVIIIVILAVVLFRLLNPS